MIHLQLLVYVYWSNNGCCWDFLSFCLSCDCAKLCIILFFFLTSIDPLLLAHKYKNLMLIFNAYELSQCTIRVLKILKSASYSIYGHKQPIIKNHLFLYFYYRIEKRKRIFKKIGKRRKTERWEHSSSTRCYTSF